MKPVLNSGYVPVCMAPQLMIRRISRNAIARWKTRISYSSNRLKVRIITLLKCPLSQDIKKRQLSSIESLSKENAEFTRVLAIRQSFARGVEFKLECDKENLALEETKHIISAIETEKEKSVELTATEDLLRQRFARAKGVLVKSMNHENIAKYLNILEKRLDRSIVRFNETLHQNSVLREEVDRLRREAQTNDTIKRKLLTDISNVKRHADEAIEETSAAYCAKEKASSDTAHLRAIADREYSEFQKEMKELNRLLEKDKQIYESLRAHEITAYVRADVPVVFEDYMSQPDSEPPPTTHVPSLYKEYLTRIKESTGVLSVEEFVSTLSRREIENFSLFNRLNDLTNQMNTLKDKIEIARAQINDSKQKAIDSISTHHPTCTVSSDVYSESIHSLSLKIFRIRTIFNAIVSILKIDSYSSTSSVALPSDLDLIIHRQLASIDTAVDNLLHKYMQIFSSSTVGPSSSKRSFMRRKIFSKSVTAPSSQRIGLSSLPSSIALSDSKDDHTNVTPLFRSSIVIQPSQNPTPRTTSRPATSSSTKASSTHIIRRKIKPTL